MSILFFTLLFLVGILTGALNTMAGGGSLLSMPLLIFMGLPPIVANATNRVGIVMQNIFAISGFKQKGVNLMRFSLPLGLMSIVGSLIGATYSLTLSDSQFKTVLAIVMILVLIISNYSPTHSEQHIPRLTGSPWLLTTLLHIFIGMYGGFIQAGVGFLSLITTTTINRLDLIKANCVKVTVALFYSSASLILFAFHGKVWWIHGLTLGLGCALGGWLGSHLSVLKGNQWLQKVITITVICMAIKLLLF